jgi:hypothetical protein
MIAPESSQERELIAFLDRLEEESETLKKDTPLKDADLNLNFVRGLQWPADDGSLTGGTDLQYKFVLNLLGPLVKRKTALLTDTRPQMEVTARYAKRRGSAETYKNTILAQWDEQGLEQVFTGELIRAMTVGSTVALTVWDPAADYGRGDLRYRVYDPRQVTLDPSVKRAAHVPMAEFVQVRDVVPLNWVREAYPKRGGAVQASEKWSRYERPRQETATGGMSGRILSAVGRAWSRGGHDLVDSAIPKVELRHTWFKDFPRGEDGKPKFGVPRTIRHVVNAGQTVLVDEPLVEWHQAYPTHFYDWDLELDHPWGIPEVGGLRRIQYTLNRMIGQIVQNTLLTNRTILVSDTDAVDNKTWNLLTSGLNGIAVRKKVGRTFSYTNPAILPPHLITLVQLLITAVDMVSGMSDASRGMRPPGVISGVAIESLQQAAQSVVRLEARAFECVTPDTEALTKRGWVRGGDLTADDELYTLDPQTGHGRWSRLLGRFEGRYVGEMISIETDTISVLCTPNHAWYVAKKSPTGVWHRRGDARFKRVLVGDLDANHRIVAAARLAPASSDVPDALVELIGWVVTEGHYTYDPRKSDGNRRVRITQTMGKNAPKCERIRACLRALGVPYREYFYAPRNAATFELGKVPSAEIIKAFPDKRIGAEWIARLSPEQCDLLYQTMIRGDGYVNKHGHELFCNADGALLDEFQMVATLAGRANSIQGPWQAEHPRHRDARYGNGRVVSLRKSGMISVDHLLRTGAITRVPYDGIVWCPQTETGSWVARRNGKVYVTGNSWLSRIFQQSLALIWQYFTTKRLISLLGPSKELIQFEFDRANLEKDDEGVAYGKERQQDLWQDFQFRVLPGSSLASTRVQRAVMALNLFNAGLVPGAEVLRAAEWPDPDGTYKQALEQKALTAQGAGQRPPKPVRLPGARMGGM